MLHLFNKVYVCPEVLLDNSKKRIIVSPNKELNQPSNLNVIKHCVDSYNDLVGQQGIYKTWEELLLSLEYEHKLRFYVDMPTFNIMFVNWMKTLFPKLDSHVAFCCYNAYVQRLHTFFPQTVTNRSFLDYNKERLLGLKFLSKEEFTKLFDSSIPWTDDAVRSSWVTKHLEDVSLEWHLSTYFNDPVHLKNFREKYLLILTKALIIEVLEWYQYIIKYFMKPQVKQELGINIKWDSEDWRGQLKTHPVVGWMFDDDLRYVSKDTTYFLAHIDEALAVGEYLKTFWFKDIKIDDAVRLLDEDYFESDHANFTFQTLRSLIKNKDTLTDEELNEIISNDFGRESVSIIFDLLNHSTKWNTILLQLIYELRDTDNDKFSQLKING